MKKAVFKAFFQHGLLSRRAGVKHLLMAIHALEVILSEECHETRTTSLFQRQVPSQRMASFRFLFLDIAGDLLSY